MQKIRQPLYPDFLPTELCTEYDQRLEAAKVLVVWDELIFRLHLLQAEEEKQRKYRGWWPFQKKNHVDARLQPLSQAIAVFSQSFRDGSQLPPTEHAQHFLKARERLWRALDGETVVTVSSLFTEASRALDPKISHAASDSYHARLALTVRFIDSALEPAVLDKVSPSPAKITRTLSSVTMVTERSSLLTPDNSDNVILDEVKQEIKNALDQQYPSKNSYFSFLNFFPSKTSRQVKKIRTLLAQPECDAVVLEGYLRALSCNEARQPLLQARQAAIASTLHHLVAPLQDGIQRLQAEKAAAMQVAQEHLEREQTKRAQRLINWVQQVFGKETTLSLEVAQQHLEKAQQYLEKHQDKKTATKVHWDTVRILALWDCFVTIMEAKGHPSRLTIEIDRIKARLPDPLLLENKDDPRICWEWLKAQKRIEQANTNVHSFYAPGSWAQDLINITSVKKISFSEALHQAFDVYIPALYSVEAENMYKITCDIQTLVYKAIDSVFIVLFPNTMSPDLRTRIDLLIVQGIAQVKATYPQFAGDDEKNKTALMALGLWRVVGNNAVSTINLQPKECAVMERRMVDALQLPTQPNIDALIKEFIGLQVTYCETWSQDTRFSFKALKEQIVKMLPPLLEEKPLLPSVSPKKSRRSDASRFFSPSSDAAVSKERASSSPPISTDESAPYFGYQDLSSPFKGSNPLRAP